MKILFYTFLLLGFSCGLEEKRRVLRPTVMKSGEVNPVTDSIDSLAEKEQKPETPSIQNENFEEEKAFLAMNRYCRSCHGVGNLRFFLSDNAKDFFKDLSQRQSPLSGRSWLESSIVLLDWPGDVMPSLDHQVVQGADWMPKGGKRILIDQETIDGQPAREFLLDYLRRN